MDNYYLQNLPYEKIVGVFENYLKELKGTKFLDDPTIAWTEKENTINAFVVRCNDINITNDMKRNNDWLFIIENTANDSFRRHVFECTADPKSRQKDIANLCEQMYLGNIRNHRNVAGRTAICQDNCEIWVRRYNGSDWREEKGNFGINIHNPAGAKNSSLGCVILATDDDYIREFRPLLRRVEKTTIPVAVIRDTKFEVYANQVAA